HTPQPGIRPTTAPRCPKMADGAAMPGGTQAPGQVHRPCNNLKSLRKREQGSTRLYSSDSDPSGRTHSPPARFKSAPAEKNFYKQSDSEATPPQPTTFQQAVAEQATEPTQSTTAPPA